MTTFNQVGGRSLDGPKRRRHPQPVTDAPSPKPEPIAAPDVDEQPVLDEVVEPDIEESEVPGETAGETDVPESAPLTPEYSPQPQPSRRLERRHAVNPLEAREAAQERSKPEPDEPIFVYRKPKKVKTVGIKVLRRIALAIVILAVLTGGWFGYKALSAAGNIIGKSHGIAPGLADKLDVTKLKGEGDGRVNILVLGIGGQGHEAPNLSDTLMVMSIDPKTKDAAMLSIPRDFYVKIPASEKTRQQYGKINAANAYGGPELAAKTVANVIGVPIHYYVLIDFSGFKQAIDAVGGVDINVPKAIYDPDYPCDNERGGYCPFKMAAGPQHMNGTVALRYARSRKSTSDFDRAARQQQVIAALRSKALQLSTLTNPVKLTGLIDAVGSHLKTDIQPKEINKLAGLAKDIDPAKTPQKVLDTESKDALLVGGTNIIPGAGYIEVPKIGNFNYSDIQDLVKNIFTDHYITDENAHVEVQNGSGVAGAAGALVRSLQAAHYNVGAAVNADGIYTKTVIYDYTGGKKPYTINYLEQRFKVKAQRATAPTPTVDANGKTVPSPQIRIILGSDYKSPSSTQ